MQFKTRCKTDHLNLDIQLNSTNKRHAQIKLSTNNDTLPSINHEYYAKLRKQKEKNGRDEPNLLEVNMCSSVEKSIIQKEMKT